MLISPTTLATFSNTISNVNRQPLNPEAPRLVLRRLVKASGIKQQDVAAAIGERPDTFSKILAGAPSYNLGSPMIVNVLNVIGEDFAHFAEEVVTESEKLQAAGDT